MRAKSFIFDFPIFLQFNSLSIKPSFHRKVPFRIYNSSFHITHKLAKTNLLANITDFQHTRKPTGEGKIKQTFMKMYPVSCMCFSGSQCSLQRNGRCQLIQEVIFKFIIHDTVDA